jgi:hypothetical protein
MPAFQVRPQPRSWPQFTVFGDYYGVDVVSADNAMAILKHSRDLAGGGPHQVQLDPAASGRTSIGPAAYNEYGTVFGERFTNRCPSHGVVDGLDQIDLMLRGVDPRIQIHPRCVHLIAAFQNYRRHEPAHGGEFLDAPVDPQHPYEDMLDCLRGGIRDAMPEGRTPAPNLRTVHTGRA